jgi:hypothetical protein
MHPEGSLPHSQELSTYPYPEPEQSSPHHPIHVCKILHNPNLVSIFRRLDRLSKESVQVRGSFEHFVASLFFYGEEL